MNISADIQNINGIGPSRAKLFSKLGISTIRDILFYFPRDYQDMSPMTFKQGNKSQTSAFPCIVTGRAIGKRAHSGIYIIKIPITDGQDKGHAIFFNQPYLQKVFYPNQRLLLVGKLKKDFGSYEILSPEWTIIKENHLTEFEKIRPVYSLSKGISQNLVRTTVKNAIKMSSNLKEILPVNILNKYKLITIEEAIKNIHFPQNFKALEKARRRFIFQELLLLQLGTGLLRHYIKSKKRKNQYRFLDLKSFLASLPFALTCGQKKVLKDIIKDLKSDHIMNRLIQGDVGSGKTLVACSALYLSVKNGFQGAMMAPTEILADQHYRTLKQYLGPFNINVGILKGGMPEKDKENIIFELKKGVIDILVGTHSIIQADVTFHKLGMVVTDEQHRFGVRQRKDLVSKGQWPDVLAMSATPIPRTVAMVLYSDLDISLIDTLPPGRQKVDTHVVQNAVKDKVYDFMASKVEKGHQAYVVCPAVEENELGLTNVKQHEKELKQKYPDLKICILHGKMKQDVKDKVLKQFLAKKFQVLVTTTVIEVGVDIPTATLMIIENAERYGLAQLHQLRGRVGRGILKSHCILISGSNQGAARKRLHYITKSHDGFKISKRDLELRGPGDFLGLRQHGFCELKFASFIKNTRILGVTHELANKILEKGWLSLPEYQNLKELLDSKININTA